MPLEPEIIDARSRPAELRLDEVAALKHLSRLMDSVFEIPGLRVKFGLDALLGLVPALGDLASSAVALIILKAAAQRGVSRVTMARMGFNLLVDWLIGSIPILGDVFDVYWKANVRNVELLERHADASVAVQRSARRSDWLFFAGLVAFLIAGLIGSLMMTYYTVRWIGGLLFGAA
jgi:hypothetical protein